MTGIAAVVATSLGAAATSFVVAQAASPPEWTAMGLLALVLGGIGTQLVKAINKNTDATNSMVLAQQTGSQAVSSLALELRALIQQNQSEAREVHSALEALPERIADRMRKPA